MTVELGFIQYGGNANKFNDLMKDIDESTANDYSFEPCGTFDKMDPDHWFTGLDYKHYIKNGYHLFKRIGNTNHDNLNMIKYLLYIDYGEEYKLFLLY